MAFTLPDLPYSHDALAGAGMSRETLEYHHDKHHNAYVEKLNELIAGSEWEGKSLEEIVKGTYQKGAVAQNGIFNNASQHWNHSQFWEMMAPSSSMPSEVMTVESTSKHTASAFASAFCACSTRVPIASERIKSDVRAADGRKTERRARCNIDPVRQRNLRRCAT